MVERLKGSDLYRKWQCTWLDACLTYIQMHAFDSNQCTHVTWIYSLAWLSPKNIPDTTLSMWDTSIKLNTWLGFMQTSHLRAISPPIKRKNRRIWFCLMQRNGRTVIALWFAQKMTVYLTWCMPDIHPDARIWFKPMHAYDYDIQFGLIESYKVNRNEIKHARYIFLAEY